MTAPTTTSNSTKTSTAANGSKAVATTGSSALASTNGKTTIADTVVAKIAGIATREINGVHDLGGSTTRAIGAIREIIPGAGVNVSQGVSVEVGESQAAVDVEIVADYGVAIHDLAAGIRKNVINAIERMTGLEVTEVNVTVHDVYLNDGSAADEN